MKQTSQPNDKKSVSKQIQAKKNPAASGKYRLLSLIQKHSSLRFAILDAITLLTLLAVLAVLALFDRRNFLGQTTPVTPFALLAPRILH